MMVTFRLSRLIGWIVAMICACALLYVLSIGPASAWVANTISGHALDASRLAKYDTRLRWFYGFYRPVSHFRAWLRFRVSGEAEATFQYYEALFHRPSRLSDGRRVFTVRQFNDGSSSQDPAKAALKSAQYQAQSTFHAGTEVYALPLTGRLLVVLAPEDEPDGEIYFDTGPNDGVTGHADLIFP